MRLALLILPMLLDACSNQPECTISGYNAPQHPNSWPELFAATDMCIDHWAKTYAKSRESAGDAADAAAAQCSHFSQMIADLSQQPESSIAKTTAEESIRVWRREALTTIFRYRNQCRNGIL
jgi:hypothetical protein